MPVVTKVVEAVAKNRRPRRRRRKGAPSAPKIALGTQASVAVTTAKARFRARFATDLGGQIVEKYGEGLSYAWNLMPPAAFDWSQYRVMRVGFEVFGASAHLVVRAGDVGIPGNKATLLAASDLQSVTQVQRGPEVIWFRPIEAIQKQWQQQTGSEATPDPMHTGLVASYWVQQTQVAAPASGYFAWVVDFEVSGPKAPPKSLREATPEELATRLRELQLAQARNREYQDDTDYELVPREWGDCPTPRGPFKPFTPGAGSGRRA